MAYVSNCHRGGTLLAHRSQSIYRLSLTNFHNGRHGYGRDDGVFWLRQETEAETTRPKEVRQEQAGIYKESNTLLHDLHAEQRHRMIFAANSQATLSISSRTPSLQSEQQSRSLSLPHACKPSASDPSSDARNDEAESQVVADRYEETNRYDRPD